MQFNEKARKDFDLNYNLIVNVQYSIGLLQTIILEDYLKSNNQKDKEDYKKLSVLQSHLTQFDILTLKKIYHDISLKLKGMLNER